MEKTAPQASAEPDELLTAFKVLEACLEGEHWFLSQVRAFLIKKYELDSYPTFSSRTGHNTLLQLTQFLFLLEALDCRSPTHIHAFIDGHNEKIDRQLKSSENAGSPKELKRAIFSTKRKLQVTDTFAYYRRPVFSVYELGHLMIDLMSPRTTENIVNDLLLGGLLRERGKNGEDIPLGTDSSRILVEPHEFLLDTYRQSLIMTRKLML